ncbi:GxxExxY protein [Niabella drilacis]|uniref:GxxExxY protein n=1 Tax=Niabella drilacis (strain DSM 25811 / CCM 8410 / CCUG 62505 / LMG 26954 / E90) TaxID=1285928 RepID=A0A1G7A258_NIADE|nr:GxxExxY protein [Niabella drilacis]SDE08145.1 GxxExxY protein [Niabella drilacis]
MSNKNFDPENYPLQRETDTIIKYGIEIHKTPGPGFLEILYKDAFEYEFGKNAIWYDRERRYKIQYKDVVLPHQFQADFVVFDTVILEIKAKEGGVAEEDLAQTINYLKCSGCKVGLILNFGKMKRRIKQVSF